MCWGEKCLEDTRDDEHWDRPGKQAYGFATREGESVTATQHSRKEKA